MLRVIHKKHPWSNAAKERTWAAFRSGGTSHSAQATTLTYIIERCETEKIGYRLTAMPGMGYWIEPWEFPRKAQGQHAATVKTAMDRLKK